MARRAVLDRPTPCGFVIARGPMMETENRPAWQQGCLALADDSGYCPCHAPPHPPRRPSRRPRVVPFARKAPTPEAQ